MTIIDKETKKGRSHSVKTPPRKILYSMSQEEQTQERNFFEEHRAPPFTSRASKMGFETNWLGRGGGTPKAPKSHKNWRKAGGTKTFL